MKLISPTENRRLNEVTGLLLLSLGLVWLLSLVSYHAADPSWNTASAAHPLNLIGYPGAYLADFSIQTFGWASYLLPLLTFLLAWRWIRSEEIEAAAIKTIGAVLLAISACAVWRPGPRRRIAGRYLCRLAGGHAQRGGRHPGYPHRDRGFDLSGLHLPPFQNVGVVCPAGGMAGRPPRRVPRLAHAHDRTLHPARRSSRPETHGGRA
jgi:hypothetical protein